MIAGFEIPTGGEIYIDSGPILGKSWRGRTAANTISRPCGDEAFCCATRSSTAANPYHAEGPRWLRVSAHREADRGGESAGPGNRLLRCRCQNGGGCGMPAGCRPDLGWARRSDRNRAPQILLPATERPNFSPKSGTRCHWGLDLSSDRELDAADLLR